MNQAYRARKRIEKRIARAGTLPMMPPQEIALRQDPGVDIRGRTRTWDAYFAKTLRGALWVISSNGFLGKTQFCAFQ